MRAALLREAAKPIEIRDDLELVEPRAGEVRVRVKYCGLCHSDLGFVTGKTPLMGPQVPGHEASGIVEALVGTKKMDVLLHLFIYEKILRIHVIDE